MRKYDLITALYAQSCRELASPEAWQAFLRSACRNYKLHFDEQLLVYAQRSEATAVLELEAWNKSFHRWVNRGATGIAVFDRDFPGKQRLKYYFDVSDTHEGQRPRPVSLWEMQPDYEGAVIETLESTFGELGNKDSLADAIFCAAENAAEDNYSDYLSDLLGSREGSMLDGLPEEYVEENFKQLLANSVAFMMMERCGVDSSTYLGEGDFTAIREFSSQSTLNAIGLAASDVGEVALREIASTVLNLAKSNENPIRTVVQTLPPDYSVNTREQTKPKERNELNDQFELLHAERLQPAELDFTTPTRSNLGQIRTDAPEISGGTPEGVFLNLLTNCTLNGHLMEIQQTATERMEHITRQMVQEQDVTEALKASDPMRWTGLMNNIRHSAEETVLTELVYS